MKNQLTKEQSQHLIDLGVPKEKASDKISYGFLGYDPIFRLTDLLAILPKEIAHSKFYMIGNGEEWEVGYCHYNGEELYPSSDLDFKAFKTKEELIDSLYELCVFCLKNGYLKF